MGWQSKLGAWQVSWYEEKNSIALNEPKRVFKHPFANKTLRGRDVKGIGDGNLLLRDNPMMIEGSVTVLELNADRIKVTGNARADVGGRTYRVYGWIDRDGET